MSEARKAKKRSLLKAVPKTSYDAEHSPENQCLHWAAFGPRILCHRMMHQGSCIEPLYGIFTTARRQDPKTSEVAGQNTYKVFEN